MKKEEINTIAQLIMAMVGIGLLLYSAGGLATLGIFLLIWANNIDYVKKD